MRDLAIIGAGPVGLEAAAAASERGLDVVVIEGGAIAQHVLDWGHVRMFTAFGCNIGPAGRRAIGVRSLPPERALLSGTEFRRAYLLPLAEALRDRLDLREATDVIEIARDGLLKGDALGQPTRADCPFRLLVEHEGAEEVIRARAVVDASGTLRRPNRAGPGGSPATGERGCADRIRYTPPDVLVADRSTFADARTLLIGGGHSAATTAVALAALARERPETSFVWLTRTGGSLPLRPIPDDPLPERESLVERANRVATDDGGPCRWVPGAVLTAVRRADDGVVAEWREADGTSRGTFRTIVANVGFEPDERLYRQLQVHECYATRGPMKLAAALLAASGDGPADCLAPTSLDASALTNPEPAFFILGSKSYGKNSAFLLERGYDQVSLVMAALAPAVEVG